MPPVERTAEPALDSCGHTPDRFHARAGKGSAATSIRSSLSPRRAVAPRARGEMKHMLARARRPPQFRSRSSNYNHSHARIIIADEIGFGIVWPNIRNDSERSLATYQMERQGDVNREWVFLIRCAVRNH